jgi:NitT/TauT family transport system ATP-binding protein
MNGIAAVNRASEEGKVGVSAQAPVSRGTEPFVVVEDVGVRYAGVNGRSAVEGVDFEVREGEFVAIIGPSGCGKSTLLKAIAGLIPTTRGSVRFRSGADSRVGFVFQADALLPWKTALANVEVALRLAGGGRSDARTQALSLLESVGLDGQAGKFPGQLSGGMRKRVALARALAYDPAVFLMDEPFSALDAQTRITVGNFFMRVLEEKQQTVLFVTHDIEEAVACADRVLVLSRGPGRVSEVIDVPIPRPRDYYNTRFVDGFAELQHKVWEALDSSHAGGEQ